VIPNCTCSVSSQYHTVSQLQNALQPSTDGLGSYYIVLSCLYACHKDFPSLKQLLCVNQPLLFSRSFSVYCTFLYLSEHSLADLLSGLIFFFSSPFSVHKGVISLGFTWVLSIGLPAEEILQSLSAADIIRGITFGKCECSKVSYL